MKFFKRKVSFGNKAINAVMLSCMLMSLSLCLTTISSTLIVGKIVGNDAISAINLVSPLHEYVYFFAGMIAIGGPLLYFRYIGAYEKDRANEIFTLCVIMAITLGIVIFVVMNLIEEPFLDSLHISDAVRFEAEEYWKFEKFLVAVVPMDFFIYELLCTNAKLNLIGNLTLFIVGIGSSIAFTNFFGTMGASLGMLVGTVASDLVMFTHFLSKNNEFELKFHFSFDDVKEIFKLSIVDSTAYLDSGLLTTFINYYVLTHFSPEMLPLTAVMVTCLDINVVFDSVGAAFAPISEVYLGEDNNNAEKDVARYSLKLALLIGGALVVAFIGLAPLFPVYFEINDPDQARLLIEVVELFAPCLIFYSASYMLISHYISIRKIAAALCFEWCRTLIFPAICIYINGSIFGFKGIWGSFLLAQVIVTLCFLILVRIFSDKNKTIWLLDDNDYPTFTCSYYANQNNAVVARNDVEKFLLENNIDKPIVNKIMMTVEDMTNLVIEKNLKKKVVLEYDVLIKDNCIYLYERDNGEIYDLSDSNMDITSFNDYVFSRMIGSYNHKQYLLSIDYNRSIFCYKLSQ